MHYRPREDVVMQPENQLTPEYANNNRSISTALYRPYPLLDPLFGGIEGPDAGLQIFTLWSSPADANVFGSLGCQETLLTQPVCPSRVSIDRPALRQICIVESAKACQ